MSFTNHILRIIRTSEAIVQKILSGPGGPSPAVNLNLATCNFYKKG